MSIVKKGIVGFWQAGEDKPPKVEFKEFVRLSYAVARAFAGSVEWLIEDEAGNNYYYAAIKRRNEKFNILCNVHYPVVAITDVFQLPPSDLQSHFIKREEVEQAIQDYGDFELVNLEDLNREITPEELSVLSEPEKEQVKYWKSSKVGEIVFNCYD